MRTAIAAVVLLAVGAAPAVAGDARPRVVAAEAVPGAARSVDLAVTGRDRDGVVRGLEVEWGDGGAQGMSTCELPARRRKGRKETFELGYAYAAPGAYTISVRVLSGGCGKRKQQRSAARTLTVQVG
jgi:hypothetical protein